MLLKNAILFLPSLLFNDIWPDVLSYEKSWTHVVVEYCCSKKRKECLSCIFIKDDVSKSFLFDDTNICFCEMSIKA